MGAVRSGSRGFRRFALTVAAVVVALAAGAASASAATIHVLNVNDAGAGSLRQAVSSASTGDTIDFPGLTGSIDLTSGEIAFDNKSLTITGPGAALLTIDGGGTGRIFNVGAAGSLTLSGVTLTHGLDTSGNGGGAILAAGPLTVSGVTFTDNDDGIAADPNPGEGGAIQANSTLGVTDSTFQGNTAVGSGSFATSGVGGAIAFAGSTSISSSTFTDNTAVGDAAGSDFLFGFAAGGAVYAGGVGTLSGNDFTANNAGAPAGPGVFDAGLGGAVFVGAGGQVTVTGDTYSDNIAGGNSTSDPGAGGGGAIGTLGPGTLSVSDATFTDNQAGGGAAGTNGGVEDAGEGFGGAIFGGAAVVVSGSTFTGNTAGGAGGSADGTGFGEGGAIEEQGDITVSSSSFATNAAGGPGGGGVQSGEGDGGAIEEESGADVSIMSSAFTGNTAGGAGGAGDFSGGASGGAVNAANADSLTVSGSLFSGNQAGGDGGGGENSGGADAAAIDTETGSIASSRFTGNRAGGVGGVGNFSGSVFGGVVTFEDVSADSSVSATTFDGNTAGGPGAGGGGSGSVSGSALAVNLDGAAFSLSDSTVTGNSGGGPAASSGAADGGTSWGALDVEAGLATLSGDTIDANTNGSSLSTADGAPLAAGIASSEDGGSWSLVGSIVANNTAPGGASSNCASPAASSSFSMEGPAGSTSCGLDLPSLDPRLQPLADNSGPSLPGGSVLQTQALGTGSPAIDVVPKALCLATDERGVTRPDGGEAFCDAGAFESSGVLRSSLSLAKSALPATVIDGGDVTDTLTATNSGPDAATSPVYTDTLPAGQSFVAAGSSTGCSAVGQVVTCSPEPDIAANSTGSVTIVAKTSVPGSGQVDGATVSSSTSPVDGSDTATVNVSPGADLSLTKTASPGTVPDGQDVTDTLTVTNLGPDPATGVTVVDVLPPGQSYQSSDASGGCTASGSVATGQTVTCTISGSVVVGTPVTVNIVVKTGAAGTAEKDTATVSAATADPVSGNNSASATVNVLPAADLSVSKSASPGTVLDGQNVTDAVKVTNVGPDPATGVTVADVLPPGQSYQSSDASGGCTTAGSVATGQTVTCTISGSVVVGTPVTVNIVVKTGAPGTAEKDTATVSAATADPVSGNNSASATVNVLPAADLSLTKTASPGTVLDGQDVTDTLTVSNAGPDPAAAPVVVDVLPAGQSYQSSDASGGCTAAGSVATGQTVTCTISGSVVAGTPVTLHVVAQTGIAGTAEKDTASVSSSTADPVAGNNSASATVNVLPAADLSLTKTASPNPVIAGQQLTYTLTVHNAGPDAASGVQVTDALPAGQPFQGASPGCSLSAGTVTCALANLAPGASESAMIVVLAPSATVANTATVSAATADPSSANNTGSVTPVVTSSCTQTLTGRLSGALSVPSGTFLCLNGATGATSVDVDAGGALTLLNSQVNGPVDANGAVFVTACGSTVTGAVLIKNSTEIVRLGGVAGSGCPPNTLGPVGLTNNTGGLIVIGNTINGSMTVTGNAGASPLADGAPEVGGNHVGGALPCTSNVPSVTNDGLPNTATGTKSGQCASL